jgi:hypothetical protein
MGIFLVVIANGGTQNSYCTKFPAFLTGGSTDRHFEDKTKKPSQRERL